MQFDGVWAIGMYWCSKRDNPTLCYIFTLLMALLIKDICSSIYERIFEAFFMDKNCRVVKTHTFSVDSMLQGDVSLDFHHRRPYPNIKTKSKSIISQKSDLRSQVTSRTFYGPYEPRIIPGSVEEAETQTHGFIG